ncbi:MAG: hypothetical protein LC785_16150 [Acidobacteria bacterium]|nr:hypothetical protein [Acidobacteriota bacterium]MCA1643436.1 hypothetical protein [Acidobacteriota bacterium]
MKRATLISIALAALMIGLPASYQPIRPVNARAAAGPPVANVSTVPLYRLYAPSTGIHFYTTDVNRRLESMGSGWKSEGVAAHVLNEQAPGTVTLYVLIIWLRFNDVEGNPVFGYTTSEQEKTTLLQAPQVPKLWGGYVYYKKSQWHFDGSGIAGYIAPTQLYGTVPLYRLHHLPEFGPEEENTSSLAIVNTDEHKYRKCRPSSFDNFYTTSEEEKAKAITDYGYKFVGVVGYVWPQPTSVSTDPPKPPGPKISAGASKPATNPDTDLLNRGCTRPGVGSYNCPTIAGYEACENYRKNGKVKACSTSANQKVQAAMEKLLFSFGCTRLLGRPDEFLCKTQKSFDLCETYRKNGNAKRCLMAKQ